MPSTTAIIASNLPIQPGPAVSLVQAPAPHVKSSTPAIPTTFTAPAPLPARQSQIAPPPISSQSQPTKMDKMQAQPLSQPAGQPLQQLAPNVQNVQNAGTKRPPSASSGASASAMTTQSQTQSHFSAVNPPTNQILSATAQFRYNHGGGLPPNEAPQIYSAIYSGVDVYEMEVNNVAVMRRRNDSWLNATQILKVAKIDKGKRTKILEKEIQTGEHEKVQGGYGKYQGTWVKFERGMEICRQYGVEEILRPLLTHDMGQDGGVAGQDNNTPTKEQAMAAQRKRMYNATTTADNRQNGVSGTFFRNISSTASHAVAAINKARIDSPGPRGRAAAAPTSRAPSFSRQPSNMSQTDDGFPPNSQQSFTSEYGNGMESVYLTQQSTIDVTEPPRKRPRGNLTPADSFSYNGTEPSYSQNFPASPTEVNESFIYNNAGVAGTAGSEVHDGFGPLAPLPYEMSQEAEDRKSQLLGLFLDPNISDQQIQDGIAGMTSRELDMPIDNHCHTVLHWAAALSRMSLLRALIRAGASPFRVNAAGQTALMRACTVTNSMELNTFPELLDGLGCTLEIRDHKGRTVLHQIAVTSAVKGRNAASRYYLESLLEWVVRQGSLPNSQASVPPSSQSQQPKMGLARFMSEIVNSQDHSGDTALNIAAKNGNKSVISQLLEVGADPNIANRSGLRPVDFGIGGDVSDSGAATATNMATTNGTTALVPHTTTSDKAVAAAKGTQSNDEIMSSIALVLSEATCDFHKEMKSKKVSVDSLHREIRSASSNLATARRQLDSIQDKVRKQTHARQQIANLTHAREDEQFRSARDSSVTSVDAISIWETQMSAVIESATDPAAAAALLPSARVLKTRMKALTERKEVMRKMVLALKGRSKETEVKYRKVVSLCTGVPVEEVDAVVEGLLRAVESEKSELELGRVRRFLGGVDGIGR